ncbi:MAG: hypothetical protein IKK57_02035 [Clostridia bacterium]|nr:hypothetical protein [Clostridia bacterium]
MLKAFLLGAVGYPALELLWRRRTHPSMALAGGLAMVIIRCAGRCRSGLLARSALCGVGITAVEYLIGCTVNRDHRIWDYRHLPLNVQGQICAPYSLLWCGLSAAVLGVTDALADRPTHTKRARHSA